MKLLNMYLGKSAGSCVDFILKIVHKLNTIFGSIWGKNKILFYILTVTSSNIKMATKKHNYFPS